MQFDLTKIINANATYIVLQFLCLEHKITAFYLISKCCYQYLIICMKVVSLVFFVFAFLNGSDNLVRCMDEGGLGSHSVLKMFRSI